MIKIYNQDNKSFSRFATFRERRNYIQLSNCTRKQNLSNSIELPIPKGPHLQQVNDETFINPSDRTRPEKFPFTEVSLCSTRISFDQNINFCRLKSWVTFRFMQLDNVAMLLIIVRVRLSVSRFTSLSTSKISPNPWLTLSKWFDRKAKFSLLREKNNLLLLHKNCKQFYHGFHNRCVWRGDGLNLIHILLTCNISAEKLYKSICQHRTHKSPSNGRLRFMIWFNEITLWDWIAFGSFIVLLFFVLMGLVMLFFM